MALYPYLIYAYYRTLRKRTFDVLNGTEKNLQEITVINNSNKNHKKNLMKKFSHFPPFHSHDYSFFSPHNLLFRLIVTTKRLTSTKKLELFFIESSEMYSTARSVLLAYVLGLMVLYIDASLTYETEGKHLAVYIYVKT